MTCVPGGPAFTARHGRDQPRTLRAGGLSDPVGLIAELVAAAEPGLAPEQIRAVVTAVAGGRAKSRRLASALAAAPRCWPTAGPRRRGPSATCCVALRQAGAAVGLAAALRAVRQAAADLPAPRPGLVLRGLRAARRTVRRVRERQTGLLAGPGRAAAMRQVPGRRRPGPGHRDLSA